MKNHSWLMLVCCLGPLFLIFLAPALGLNSSGAFFVFIVAMFLCSFMMTGKGGGCCGGHHEEKSDKNDNKEEEGKHGCH